MTVKRTHILMIVLLSMTFVGIFGAIFLGNKLLSTQSNKLIEQKINNKGLENQKRVLNKAQQDIQKYKNLEEITQAIVPRDKDQARAVREIITLATESKISIQSITFPSSNLGTKVQQPKATESTEGSGQDNKQTPATPPANPISQAIPVKDIDGLYSLEINIVPEGNVDYYRFIDFLAKLEKNRRTSQVTSISIMPKSSSKQNPQLSFTLTINIFLKP